MALLEEAEGAGEDGIVEFSECLGHVFLGGGVDGGFDGEVKPVKIIEAFEIECLEHVSSDAVDCFSFDEGGRGRFGDTAFDIDPGE